MSLKTGQYSPFQICLSDPRGKKREWYLQLVNGFQGVSIDFLAADSQNIYLQNVGKKTGDFDEQRDWKGGRGGEYVKDDPSKFSDSKDCWTLSTGHVTPTLLAQYATGYRSVTQYMPGSGKSLTWKASLGDTRFISSKALGALTASSKAWIYIRRIGNPGTATLELRAADTGAPNGAVRKSAIVTTTTITDVLSVFYPFAWSATQNVTSGDFLVFYGAATDNAQKHWEIGVDESNTGSYNSATGTGTWDTSTFSLFHRVTDADTDRRWFFFNNYTTFCMVDKKTSGASQLYTADSVGAVTEVAITSMGTVTGRPVVGNANKTYFPQGESDPIRTWDGATGYGDDGSNVATFLAKGYDSYNKKPTVWKANSTQGTATTVAVAPSDGNPLTFATAIPLGESNTPINGIQYWEGETTGQNALYVFKTDSAWVISQNSDGTYSIINKKWGLENTPSEANGTFALGVGQFLYFPWLFSLERLYSGQLDDIGQGWEGAGLPSGREGAYAAGCAYVGFQFYALDAGTGTSCVMGYDGVAWHEIFRAPAAGMRIRDALIQPISSARAKLWFDCGGDLLYIILPLNKARPIDDPACMYTHEGVLYSSIIDAGAAAKLPKLIKSMTATTRNLNGDGIRMEMDYQVDDNVGKDGFENWIPVQPFMISPESTVDINAVNISQFAYRLRLGTTNNLIPPDLRAIVPNGLARGTTRTVWQLQVKGEEVYSNGKASHPDELLAYLVEAQQNPGSVLMTSTSPLCGGGEGVSVELSLQRIQPITDAKSSFILNLISI